MNVFHILHNSFKNDSRVLKELQSLNKVQEITQIVLLCLEGDNLPKEEKIFEKVWVKRLKKPRLSHTNFFLKGFGFFLWALTAVKNLKTAKPQIIHCHDLTGLFIGFLYKMTQNTFLIYDSHEFQTEIKNLKGLRKILLRSVETLCSFKVNSFITVSDSIGQNYRHKYGLNDQTLILNCPNSNETKNSEILRKHFNLAANDKIFIYQGGFSRGRGIELLLETFEKQVGTNNHIVFMGFGELEEVIKLKEKEYKNIHFHQAVSVDKLLAYTSSADIGICLTDKSCLNHVFCLPNKFFEYINAGIPVITNDLYELEKIIGQFHLGITIKNETVRDLTKAIETFDITNPIFKQGASKASKIFNWEEQEKELNALYRRILTKLH